MDNLYIVMPAYNEEKNIEYVINSWYHILEKAGEKSKLIIASSGSTDLTNNILYKLKNKLPKLEILSNTKKEHGPKIIALYKYAIQNNIDYVFQTDSDGQTNPDEFDKFWDNRNKYDAIIGNRTIRGDGKERAFIQSIVCFILMIFFGVRVPDANAPFRLMKTKLIQQYIDRIPYDYNIPNIMFTTFFVYYRNNIEFKKISFKPRRAGKNSINIVKIIKIGINSLKDFYNFKKYM